MPATAQSQTWRDRLKDIRRRGAGVDSGAIKKKPQRAS